MALNTLREMSHIMFQVSTIHEMNVLNCTKCFCTGFLEKNRDSFSQDLKNVVQQSSNDFLKKLFESEFKEDSKTKKTLSAQFRTSLDILMKNLSVRHPYFVRCIKPNEQKKPHVK